MKRLLCFAIVLGNALLIFYVSLLFLHHSSTPVTFAHLPPPLSLHKSGLAQGGVGTFQDFDEPNNGTPYTTYTITLNTPPQLLDGGPPGSSQFLRLAFPAPTPHSNGIGFDRSDAGAFDQVVAEFDFRMWPGTGQADGFGFALLNTADYGISSTIPAGGLAEEPNYTGSLGVGFDIYENLGEISNNHISLHLNNNQIAEIDIDPANLDLAGGQWIHARLIMRPGGGFSDITIILTPYGGTAVTVVQQFPIPGFTPYEGRAHFAARSGGESAEHDIDNVHLHFLDLGQSVISFETGAYTAQEIEPDTLLTITRSGIASGTVTVDYATSDGTALAGLDYVPLSGTLLFAHGEITKTINISILPDGEEEDDEDFFVTLNNISGGDVLGEPYIAQVTILPDPRATYQDFDLPNTGTPYVTATVPPPTYPAALIAGGITDIGQFIRLGFGESAVSHNTLAFARTGVGHLDQVVADFDFRITPGTGRADGFGFALLNTNNYGFTGTIIMPDIAEEPNFSNSLGIGFDIYQSDNISTGLELNYNHISLHYDGAVITEVNAFPALDLAGSQWIHAQVIVRPDPAYADVSIILTQCGRPPVTIIDRFPIPNLVPYDSRVHFAARAGGLLADFDLDNIKVQSVANEQSYINFNTNCYVVVETDDAIALTVIRSGNLTNTVTLDYATSNHTAAAGEDYEATTGTLTFNSGETTQTIVVPLIDDTANEGDENFIVTMSNPNTGNSLAGPSVITVKIIDDEQARTVGHWSEVIPSEVIPIQAMMLPTGEVMYWDRDSDTSNWDPNPRIWHPITEVITATATVEYELFCSGHTFLEDGRLLATGGHYEDIVGDDEASIYDPFTNTWERLPQMNKGRWYPSNVTLPNSNVLVMAGTYTLTNGLNTVPQIWQITNTQWISLPSHGVYPDYADYYPYLYVSPNGQVFNAGPQQMARYLDVKSGLWTDVDASAVLYRDYGTSVMYDDGMVMVAGGNPRPDLVPDAVPTSTVEIINLYDSNPTWQTTPPMNFGRRHLNATLLPDGKVLVTGGSSAIGFDNRNGAVLEAEMWDPETQMWTIMAPQALYRGYHSVALLLPDGRVLVGGGGHPDPDGLPQYNFEIYSPPYLFKGPRPQILSAPSSVLYGETFFVQTPDAAVVDQINLVRLSAVTHAYNQDQRINKNLPFTQSEGGLTVTAPSDDKLATPGYYMLFILDSAGIPSTAHIIQITHQTNSGMQVSTQVSAAEAEVGTMITYTYHLTNTGNVLLDSLIAYDDKLGQITLPVNNLSPNASLTTTAVYTITESDLPGPLITTITITGTPSIGSFITTTATTAVDLTFTAVITVAKQANVSSASKGQTIIYTYTLTNTGNVSLHSLIAYDDKLGTVPLPINHLLPNTSLTATIVYLITESDLPGPLTNTVTVTGTPPIGSTTTATATLTIMLTNTMPKIFLPFIVKN